MSFDDLLHRPHGRFNVAKCVQYLRYIGVEVAEEQAQSWSDMEKVHRFIGSTRRTARDGVTMSCLRRHIWTGIMYRRGSGFKGQEAHNKRSATCPQCGRGATTMRYDWHELRDGSFHDHRPKSERWKSIEDYAQESTP